MRGESVEKSDCLGLEKLGFARARKRLRAAGTPREPRGDEQPLEELGRRSHAEVSTHRTALVMKNGVIATLWLAVACGGHVSSVQPEDYQKACADFANSACERSLDCSSPTGTATPSDVATCVRISTAHCTRRALAKRPVAPASALSACAAAIRSMTCDEYGAQNGCPYPGPLADGDPCLNPDECASGSCDLPGVNAASSLCGRCRAAPKEGDPCTTGCGSAPDLLCYPDSTGAGHCGRMPGDGEACGNGPCQDGLICYQGRCVATTALPGDPCDPSAGVYCDTWRSDYCDPLTSTCQRPASAGLGEPCGVLADRTYATCASSGGYCLYASPTDRTGTCTAFLADGAPCTIPTSPTDLARLPRCESPAICARALGETTGTCQIVGSDYCR